VQRFIEKPVDSAVTSFAGELRSRYWGCPELAMTHPGAIGPDPARPTPGRSGLPVR